ncbi:MAG: DHH family phosphoesterase [Bacteroidaceae bacterium]|nr:DHH family phosphoesterase [Bacteroidaceae bacterium]
MTLKTQISPQEVQQVKKLFDGCKNVVIVTHQSPDGDAIGSTLALWEYLTRKGKNATIIVPNYFPDFLKWMNGSDKIILFERRKSVSYNLLNMADLVCVLDLNEFARMGDEMGKVVAGLRRTRKLLIDHHLDPEKNHFDTVISRPKCSSTCELLFRLLTAIGGVEQMPFHGFEDIYAGMYTDTGGFSFNSNDPDIFLILAELLQKGIDKDRIVRNINNFYTADRFRLMGYVLYEKLQVFPELHASVFSITKEELKRFNYLKGDMEGIVNMPLGIRGHKLSISLREDTEKPVIWVSIRSYDEISAQDMATRFFNGGGHFNAAGGRLLDMTMEQAIEKAKEAIEAFREQLTNDN